MIYDRIENLGMYKGISGNLDRAIEFLLNFKGAATLGRIDILEDKVYANVMEYTSKQLEDAVYEAHGKYIDIHVVLEGEEELRTSAVIEKVVKEFDAEGDFALYECKEENRSHLTPGRFAICFLSDLHMPGVAIKDSIAVKKMVVKVKVD